MWDDPALKTMNPGVDLPHQTIIPYTAPMAAAHTFIFSQYLAFSTPSWGSSVAYGTTISWPPVQGGIGAEGNPGMVNALKGNPYSIAYIGISFKNATTAASLGEAMLQNKAGKFVLATPQTVSAAVAATSNKTPADERVSLIFAEGDDFTRSSIMNMRSSKRSSHPRKWPRRCARSSNGRSSLTAATQRTTWTRWGSYRCRRQSPS